MRWKTMQVALWIGIAALATEVIAAPQAMDAHASKINAILDRWQVVEANKGGDVALWRDMMSIQLKQVGPGTLGRLLALETGSDAGTAGQQYQAFITTLGTDIALRLRAQKAPANATARALTVQALEGTNSPSGGTDRGPADFGSTTIDQTFTPITPCRVVDTRNVGGPIGAFATRNFYFYTNTGAYNWGTNQGGVAGAASSVCPGTFITGFIPSAAVATVTVTGQGGNGNLIVWQGTSPVASASTMSYPASGDTSSLATIPEGGRSGAGPGGAVLDFGVFVNAFSATNVVVDIVGYYTPPGSTPLSCTTVQLAGVGTANVPNNTEVDFPTAAACPAGFGGTSISCQYSGSSPAGLALTQVGPPPPSGFFACIWRNQTGLTLDRNRFFTTTACCATPGHP
jgi:hypothetical protein